MSPTATTHTQLYSETYAMYTLRLQGGIYQPPSPVGLSPLDTPQVLQLSNGRPRAQVAPPMREYYDRTQTSPPLARRRPIPLPRIGGESGGMNPLLERMHVPMISYDIVQAPGTASLDARHHTSGRTFHEPATFMPTTSLTIRVPFSSTPVVIHRHGATITVSDVLTSIHVALRKAAQECGCIIPVPSIFSNDQGGSYSEYYDEPVLSSMLGNRSQWAGLSESSVEPNSTHNPIVPKRTTTPVLDRLVEELATSWQGIQERSHIYLVEPSSQ